MFQYDDDQLGSCCKVLLRITKHISGSVDFNASVDRPHLFNLLQPIQIDLNERSDYDELCNLAALNKHIKCFQFAHEMGFPWTSTTACVAATRGIDLLVYAHTNRCLWDSNTCLDAAYFGNLDCLKYAHGNGCPWS